ncbi:MAG: cell envelope integrity protein CreD [Phycisphaeraceae bacterium]|nr:cell envelope integrity protein CreD [Phycisphaeraceae bacterium]
MKRHAISIKMAGILVLVLLLLIPLDMIMSLVSERMGRRDQTVSSISGNWGHEQVVVGPVLIIPYQYPVKVWQEQLQAGKLERFEVEEIATARAYFLPAELNMAGDIQPSRLYRGIYQAVVYQGSLALTGRFDRPDFAELGIAQDSVQWDQAMISLAVSDLRGTGGVLNFQLGSRSFELTPGSRLNGYPSGLTARTPGLESEQGKLDFRMTLDLKGSGGISFAPLGKQNQVTLHSTWPDPSFQGAFLPTQRQVSAKGFDASWAVSWYGRHYPQQTTDRETDRAGNYAFSAEAIGSSLFGVQFVTPVDAYRMTQRAVKYGIFFIVLVFTAFFLFEILLALRIHPLQYTLVGAAICLFYLAVLSLSEFLLFAWAYWIGALASALLIVLYSLKVLGSGRRTSIIAAALLVIDAYLYVVLRLQDYSLLVGTVGLFAVLGTVMYLTRNLDWSTRQ